MYLKKYKDKFILLSFSLYKSLKLLLNVIPRLRFDLPEKNEYLILDENSKTLISIFKISEKSSILKTRNEEFYFWIILSSLSKLDSIKLSSLYKSYLSSCISYINPRLILTYIHNNELFWKICKDINSNIYIFQNGYCAPDEYIPKKSNTSQNTVFFTLTRERSRKIISNGVASIPFGSIESNSISKTKLNPKNRIIFISQYRYYSKKKKSNFNLENLSYDQYYSYDYDLLDIVDEFSKSFNLELYFIGSSLQEKNIKSEKDFFKLKNRNIKYQKRFIDLKEKFEFLDNSHLVVGIDSSLLYECLGRDIQTFICSSRGYKEYNYSKRPFLESVPNNESGEFWTNKFDKDLILTILKKMHLNSQENKSKSKYYSEVPYYNPINLKMTEQLLKRTKNKA